MGIWLLLSRVSSGLLSGRILSGRIFKGTRWRRVFCGSVVRDTNWGMVFWSFRVVKFLKVRFFFREGFFGLLANEVFPVFAPCFVGLALDGGLISFLLRGCSTLFLGVSCLDAPMRGTNLGSSTPCTTYNSRNLFAATL